MTKRRKTIVIVICTLIAIVMALGSCAFLHHEFTTVDKGVNVKSVSWLPAGASSMTFYKAIFIREARFNISEKEFVDFAKKEGFLLEEIIAPATARCSFIDREKWKQFEIQFDKNPNVETCEAMIKAMEWTIKDGLFFEKRCRNNGGYIFAYDRGKSLGYYQWAHH